MAKLNAHREEILSLLEAGSSQAEVIRHFEQRGITISRSTLSDFVRQRQEREVVTAAVEDDGLSERMVATLSFQRAIADELTEQLVDVGEALQQLKREGDSHHTALLAAIGHTHRFSSFFGRGHPAAAGGGDCPSGSPGGAHRRRGPALDLAEGLAHHRSCLGQLLVGRHVYAGARIKEEENKRW